ncbi:histidine kinase [uncultured Pontibacter sp.]|uniref:sensor histidine kinase n=1 Tax=uncultured Pontibacter sp. TaxID=453356 RepID=UPI0026143EDB|nr:histidine kinase [uncultured Pontibacter sp.]
MRNTKVYWICQLSGWGLYGLFSLTISRIFQGTSTLNLKLLLFNMIFIGLMILFTHLLRLQLKRRQWLSLPLSGLLLRLLPSLLLLAMASQLVMWLAMVYVVHLYTLAQTSFVAYWGYVFYCYIILLLWASLYVSVTLFRQRQQQEVDRWKLEASLKDTELQALRTQINPHFMFNSLNNIRSLVCEDPERARQMITNLSELLRYGLQYTQQERVPLERELEVVQSYLLLESIQLEERLQYTFEVDEEALQVEIPPMSVQLLVENAIKHGISQLPQGGTIHIKAYVQEGQLQVEVTNTGQLAAVQKPDIGIGLRNASERLRLLFGRSTLQLLNKTPDTVSASFAVPLALQV